jgi:hypothetical protein
MSYVADVLRTNKTIYFVWEIDDRGTKKYFSNATFVIPNSAGSDILVEGKILNHYWVGNRFDFRTMRYSVSYVSLSLSNNDRFQDSQTFLDGAEATCFIYAAGLDYADIQKNGIVFCGNIQVDRYSRKNYKITINDFTKNLSICAVPFISGDRWDDITAQPSSENAPYPIVYGNKPYFPIYYVDDDSRSIGGNTLDYVFILAAGKILSVDADYTGGEVEIVDSDGTALSAANYELIEVIDRKNFPVTVINHDNSWATLEGTYNPPYFASARGYYDNGEFTGGSSDADNLIEHPAAVSLHLLTNYSDIKKNKVDRASALEAKQRTPGLKVATAIINEENITTILNRFSEQFFISYLQRGGKVSFTAFDINRTPTASIDTDNDAISDVEITRTPEDLICNYLYGRYYYKPWKNTYGGNALLNHENDYLLKLSEQIYGRRKKIIEMSEVGQDGEGVAFHILRRYRDFFAFRHDLLSFAVEAWLAWDILEGDCVAITCPVGESGWQDENFICIERSFSSNGTAKLLFWRINPNKSIGVLRRGYLELVGGGFVEMESGKRIDLVGG